eukprot:762712-Amphidinium_carterae.1
MGVKICVPDAGVNSIILSTGASNPGMFAPRVFHTPNTGNSGSVKSAVSVKESGGMICILGKYGLEAGMVTDGP